MKKSMTPVKAFCTLALITALAGVWMINTYENMLIAEAGASVAERQSNYNESLGAIK